MTHQEPHLNQDLVKGNIFDKDLGSADNSCAPVTLLDPSEIINRLSENWHFSVPTDILPIKDNMYIEVRTLRPSTSTRNTKT